MPLWKQTNCEVETMNVREVVGTVHLGYVSQMLLLVATVETIVVRSGAAPIELKRHVTTVAGKYGHIGDKDGFPGMSELSSPHAMCRGRNSDEILLGTVDRFRAFSRKNRETTTITAWETDEDQNSGSRSVKVDKPRACVQWTVGDSTFVYFVESMGEVKYFKDSGVFSHNVVRNGSLTGVALYGNHLYLTEQNTNTVWTCEVGSDGDPIACHSHVALSAKCSIYGPIGIAATQQGIFVVARGPAKQGTICWFDLQGHKIAEVDGEYVDITSTRSGDLLAATQNELHRVSTDGNKLTTKRFAGGSTNSCLPNTEGDDTLLCEITRLLVVTEYEMYVTSEKKSVLRSVTLPPVYVQGVFPGRPLPVGYPDKDIMEWIVGNLTEDINTALGTTESIVASSSVHVDSTTWLTNFTAGVQQPDFDDEKTEQALHKSNYEHTKEAADEYYNLTDEQVYMDSTMVPYCNRLSLDALRRKLAKEAGEVLNFTLIYADMPLKAESSDAGNITTVKLLMPASFNNTVTHDLLSDANLTETAHSFIKYLRSSDTHVDVTFSNPPFNFSSLTPDEEQEVRWYIHDEVMNQIKKCEERSTGRSMARREEVGDHSRTTIATALDSNVTGVCQSTITNRTVSLFYQPPYVEMSLYEVFIPGNYTFDVSECVGEIDWQDLNDHLNNDTVRPTTEKAPKCGRVCLIIIAVVCALIVAVLIVLAVVFTSKRRRLAAVVAPARPKFVSTLDEDEQDYASAYGNKERVEQ
ncbi:hypothetical protein DPX39_080042700 [Trypanosoma brucei equiperdum]|uniref:Uncharacterized protein n=1 Tax=Trypanosoma brucei equiperdum TaxID=630700 RepID=A0A3L6L8K9_9TRYP|nr:hypothetical protein DPX39_080042700 [Trypanosoma brucei equiperdum]